MVLELLASKIQDLKKKKNWNSISWICLHFSFNECSETHLALRTSLIADDFCCLTIPSTSWDDSVDADRNPLRDESGVALWRWQLPLFSPPVSYHPLTAPASTKILATLELFFFFLAWCLWHAGIIWTSILVWCIYVKQCTSWYPLAKSFKVLPRSQRGVFKLPLLCSVCFIEQRSNHF